MQQLAIKYVLFGYGFSTPLSRLVSSEFFYGLNLFSYDVSKKGVIFKKLNFF